MKISLFIHLIGCNFSIYEYPVFLSVFYFGFGWLKSGWLWPTGLDFGILGSQWNFGSLSCEKGWFLVFLMKGLIPLATFFQKQTKPPSCLTTRWFSPLSLEPINQQDSRLHNDILVNWMFFSSHILYTGPKKSWNLNLQWWKLILNNYRRRNYIIQKG